MFTGEHERLLDDKGRLVLPPVFRRQLVGPCYVKTAPGPCVQIFPAAEIEKASERLDERVRAGEVTQNAQRRWAAGITEVKADAQGRLPIPQKLREFIGADREVILIGVSNRAELWHPDEWGAVEQAVEDDDGNEALWI